MQQIVGGLRFAADAHDLLHERFLSFVEKVNYKKIVDMSDFWDLRSERSE